MILRCCSFIINSKEESNVIVQIPYENPVAVGFLACDYMIWLLIGLGSVDISHW